VTELETEKLKELLDYLLAWSDARTKYFQWIEEDYNRRRGTWEASRKRGRRQLAAAVKGLKFGRDGRVMNGGGAIRAKRKFRTQRDRVLRAVVLNGQQVFGIEGDWNAAGIYVGTMDDATRALVVRQIRKACGL